MELNKIYNMDCLEGMKQMADNSVDLVVTDPPYKFLSKSSVSGGGFFNDKNKQNLIKIKNKFGLFFNPKIYLSELKRIMKNFNLYIFTNKNLIYDYIKFAKYNKYVFDILLWIKPNPVPINKGHYLIDKEYIIYIRSKGATFNSNLGYNNYFTYFSYPIGVKQKWEHPTIKPIELIKKIIKISSNENDIVLDPFMGSGTTAVACKQLNRKFIGFETSKEYCDIANKRLSQDVLFNFDKGLNNF